MGLRSCAMEHWGKLNYRNAWLISYTGRGTVNPKRPVSSSIESLLASLQIKSMQEIIVC